MSGKEQSQKSGLHVSTGRRHISDTSLHISCFVLVKRDRDSILLLKAGDHHPLRFKRGKFLLPASMLNFGESPDEAARRVLRDQLKDAEGLQLKFLTIQSYLGAHWDICFTYECDAAGNKELNAKEPFTQVAYYPLSSLPRNEIAADHLEVIDGLQSVSSDRSAGKAGYSPLTDAHFGEVKGVEK